MAKMALDEILRIVSDWLSHPTIKQLGVQVYGFGSAFRDGGTQFDLHRSDIDGLGIIPASVNRPEERLLVAQEFASGTSLLQKELAARPELGCRSDILSLNLFTNFEFDWSIVENADPMFFRGMSSFRSETP